MSYTITKEFAFEAAHHLNGLLPDHPCARVHGHSYRVVVELSSPFVDPDGFVTDFHNLDPFKAYLDSSLDHRDLNEVLPGLQPSSEILARHLFKWIREEMPNMADFLTAVRISETAKSWAEYRL